MMQFYKTAEGSKRMSTEQLFCSPLLYGLCHSLSISSSGQMSLLQIGLFSILVKGLPQQSPKITGLPLSSVELPILLQSQAVLG